MAVLPPPVAVANKALSLCANTRIGAAGSVVKELLENRWLYYRRHWCC